MLHDIARSQRRISIGECMSVCVCVGSLVHTISLGVTAMRCACAAACMHPVIMLLAEEEPLSRPDSFVQASTQDMDQDRMEALLRDAEAERDALQAKNVEYVDAAIVTGTF